MVVMSFDLSSSCIGLVVAKMENKKVKKIMSCPIAPPSYNPSELGFLKSKKKIKTPKGKIVNSYVKPGESVVSQKEATSRNSFVRQQKDIYVLSYISNKMGSLVDSIKPDLILIEKNAVFNGILTSILLAKVMGTLHGLAGRISVPVKEYSVTTVRKHLDTPTLIKELIRNKTDKELKAIPDITKRALNLYMSNKYKITFSTDDESDACVLLDYWIENILKDGA